jgi:hypothetical protein
MVESLHPVDRGLTLPILALLAIQYVLVLCAGAVAVPLTVGGPVGPQPDHVTALISPGWAAGRCGRGSGVPRDIDAGLTGRERERCA